MLNIEVFGGILNHRAVQFAKDDDGAVSVDWVVLTAALVGLAVTAATTVRDSVGVLADSIETEVADTEVNNGN